MTRKHAREFPPRSKSSPLNIQVFWILYCVNVSIIKSSTQVPWNHSSEVCEIESMGGWHAGQTHSCAFLDLAHGHF